MKKASIVALVLLALTSAPAAYASPDGVGLGLSIGTVFPKGGDIEFSDVGLDWGFWVDIPIAWTFHISPSAEIYNVGGDVDGDTVATDIIINFKFIVPVSFLKLFFGAAGGVTVFDGYAANAGLIAGASFPLIGNLEAFVSAKYKILIDDPNIHMIHANAGLLFVF